jgi:hypothetical protein
VGEPLAQRDHLPPEPVDLAQCHLDGLAPGLGEVGVGQALCALWGGGLGDDRHALVEQGGVDPLEPGGALVQQVLVQADGRPGLQHVSGRDPRLRHTPIPE